MCVLSSWSCLQLNGCVCVEVDVIIFLKYSGLVNGKIFFDSLQFQVNFK